LGQLVAGGFHGGAGGGGCGVGEEVAIVFSGEAVSFPVKDEDCVYSRQKWWKYLWGLFVCSFVCVCVIG